MVCENCKRPTGRDQERDGLCRVCYKEVCTGCAESSICCAECGLKLKCTDCGGEAGKDV